VNPADCCIGHSGTHHVVLGGLATVCKADNVIKA
jgi:hypothetical protein